MEDGTSHHIESDNRLKLYSRYLCLFQELCAFINRVKEIVKNVVLQLTSLYSGKMYVLYIYYFQFVMIIVAHYYNGLLII